MRYGVKLLYSGYTKTQLCYKLFKRATRDPKRADLKTLKFAFDICSAYSQTAGRTFESIISFFSGDVFYIHDHIRLLSFVEDFESRSGYKVYIKSGVFVARRGNSEHELWDFSSFNDPILMGERKELDRLYKIEHLFDELKGNEPAKKRKVTWLNACQLCGFYSVPKKVTWRSGINRWDRINKRDWVKSKEVLCTGCWNKVKHLAKIKDEAEENKTLINKLKRAITKRVRENG